KQRAQPLVFPGALLGYEHRRMAHRGIGFLVELLQRRMLAVKPVNGGIPAEHPADIHHMTPECVREARLGWGHRVCCISAKTLLGGRSGERRGGQECRSRW